ncbi:DUF2950 domain-containing protein [Tunturiibacter gelidoferens]|uniref:DUF2950 domain-containing protein n=1 Tax=Tunturiibacter lichenicola TaxID=2051959 RepID=A0A7Y9NJL9_9BACT|nr:DUF2950 domain-containing protein [Edaphobacter lichenicola]NYF50566.1 hypothetical protein [Edaphobacter lichenicola]
MSLTRHKLLFTLQLLFLAVLLPLVACKESEKPSTSASSLSVFASPDDAGNALLTAAKSGDQNVLTTIFGPDSRELINSGDAVQDKHTLDLFVAGYVQMHRWRKMPDNSQILLVGADNFPFPIPLKTNTDGKWFFDTAAGKEEVLNRRIGRNELAIIDVCEAAADAEAEYFYHPHDGEKAKEYAAKFLSDPDKQNGLYWKSADGQPASPLGPLAAAAASDGYSANPEGHTAFHGYYFRMLKGQTDKAPGGAKEYVVNGKMTGGFAFVAYPATYGNSGVMTFIINQDGVLLQKDLGKTTTETASAMSEFDPDSSWTIVEQ